MAFRRNPDAGRRAASLLATAFVVLIGMGATAFTVLSFAEQGGWQPWVVWAVLFGTVILLLWALIDQPEKGGSRLQLFWRQSRNKVDPLTLYKPRKKRFTPEEPWGSNQPPTLESLRESAQENSVRWVPQGPPPAREPKRRP